MSLTERFDALPEDVQRLLIRIARQAAGMSTIEKEQARLFFGSMGLSAVTHMPDEGVPAAEMVSACGRIVTVFDEAAGDAASGLVVR